MSKKPKDQTLAEASRDLYENRMKFHADYMEYVMKLNEVEAKKKFDFVENVRGECEWKGQGCARVID